MKKSWKSWLHRPPPRPLWGARKHCTVASDDKVLTLFPGSARWWFFTCQPAILSWDSGTLTPNPGRSRDPECWLSACLNEPQTCRTFRRKSGRSCADDKTGDHYNDNDNWLFRCKSWHHVLTIRQVVMTKTMIVIIDDIDATVYDHMQQDRWRDRNILFVINPMPLWEALCSGSLSRKLQIVILKLTLVEMITMMTKQNQSLADAKRWRSLRVPIEHNASSIFGCSSPGSLDSYS